MGYCVFERTPRAIILIGQKQLNRNAQGKLFLNIIGAFNQFWTDLARERATEMVQRHKEEGKPIGRPKKLDADELDQVYEWREKGLSYGEIATLAGEIFGTIIILYLRMFLTICHLIEIWDSMRMNFGTR